MDTTDSFSFSPLLIGMMRLGAWGANLSTKELEYFIDACIDLDLNDFDHADIYGDYTEEGRFGDVIKRRPDLKSKIQVTTKCGIKLVTPNRPDHKIKSYDSTRAHIILSAEKSLEALGIDHIDVLLLHRPDYLMDPQEIAEAFTTLKTAGKVKNFGVSNFRASQFEMLNALTPLITNQVEISILHRTAFKDGTLDQCQRLGIRPMAWSPFGGGKIFTETADPILIKVKQVLNLLRAKYHAQEDQILLSWLLKHPARIIPVLGTTKIDRVKKAKAALEIKLSHQDWYQLWEAAIGKEVA